jgi:hypothetical protein
VFYALRPVCGHLKQSHVKQTAPADKKSAGASMPLTCRLLSWQQQMEPSARRVSDLSPLPELHSDQFAGTCTPFRLMTAPSVRPTGQTIQLSFYICITSSGEKNKQKRRSERRRVKRLRRGEPPFFGQLV